MWVFAKIRETQTAVARKRRVVGLVRLLFEPSNLSKHYIPPVQLWVGSRKSIYNSHDHYNIDRETQRGQSGSDYDRDSGEGLSLGQLSKAPRQARILHSKKHEGN
jgi:hypothetical protein